MAELETNVTTEETAETENKELETVSETVSESAEVARLKSELAKAKAATDKATKEAAESKRALRAKQTAEEVAAEEAKAQQEAMLQELEQLRKERAVGKLSQKVFGFTQDDKSSGDIAELLYGAADAEGALDLIQKAWAAKEKALRLEFGKIPAPGVGGSEGTPLTKKEILDIKDPVARQKAISENMNLFMKG